MRCSSMELRASGEPAGAGRALTENLVICGCGGRQVMARCNQNSGKTLSQEVSDQPASHLVAGVFPGGPTARPPGSSRGARPSRSVTGNVTGVELSHCF